ncbi:hypothetical protein SISNIDRAFT_468351 [Sistotremastrum niveocremeum HHB9708]|uniref:Uncharacterized protein n=1 Tax=Sistotremastrum niveocremeum HHB9708 TaxID=1314777 RepID=A0A164RHH8_9AGAM|nr:hypothetical protein SISNIDRAFT_468351 [Sistotremastrum niveocremeum HHB9708]
MEPDTQMHSAQSDQSARAETRPTPSSRVDTARQLARFHIWLHRKTSPNRDIAKAARRESAYWRKWAEKHIPPSIAGNKRKYENISDLSPLERREEEWKAQVDLSFKPMEQARLDYGGRKSHLPWSPWTLSVDYKFSDAQEFPGFSDRKAIQPLGHGQI